MYSKSKNSFLLVYFLQIELIILKNRPHNPLTLIPLNFLFLSLILYYIFYLISHFANFALKFILFSKFLFLRNEVSNTNSL